MGDLWARGRNWLIGHKPPDAAPSGLGDGNRRNSPTNFNMSPRPSRQDGQRALNIARQPISCPLKVAAEDGQLQNVYPQAGLGKTIRHRPLVARKRAAHKDGAAHSSDHQAKRCLIILLMATLTAANSCLCLSSSIGNHQNAHHAHYVINNNATGANGTTTSPQSDRLAKVVPCEQESSQLKVMSASERLVSGRPMETLPVANNNQLAQPRSMASRRTAPTPTAPRSAPFPTPANNNTNKLARTHQLNQLGAQPTQSVASIMSRDSELAPAASGDNLEPLVMADSKKKKKMMKKKKKMEKKHKEWKKGKKHKKKKYESKKKKGGSSKKKKGKKEKKKWGMEKKGHKKKGNFKKKKWGHKKKMKKGHKKGKKGHKMLKDKGHKKKGFKKVYHKEEWGKKKKWHDIKREKKWNTKNKKWKKKWHQEKGKKYKGKHMKKYEKKNKHGKKYKKEKKSKWKKHKGEKFKKGHKKKKEEYSKKKEGGKKKKMKKEMKKMKKKKG